MEKEVKLARRFLITVFSIITICIFLLTSCFEEENTLEWSVHNYFEEDVQLFIYTSYESIERKLNSPFFIKAGDSAIVYTINTIRGGSGDFTSNIDSAIIKTTDDNNFVAIWRQGQEPYFAEGYEVKQDFFSWTGGDIPFYYTLVYSQEHIKFRFYLSNVEQ